MAKKNAPIEEPTQEEVVANVVEETEVEETVVETTEAPVVEEVNPYTQGLPTRAYRG